MHMDDEVPHHRAVWLVCHSLFDGWRRFSGMLTVCSDQTMPGVQLPSDAQSRTPALFFIAAKYRQKRSAAAERWGDQGCASAIISLIVGRAGKPRP